MAWQDRHYYRDQSGRAGSPLMWMLMGSVPLFTAFGIRVRAHASLIIYIVLVTLFGLGAGYAWQDRVQHVTVLFAIVLLHEFGHCFTARWVGGEANDILMHPLGGLAMASPPHRPWPTFLTVAGGPAVNVFICIVCGLILYTIGGWTPWKQIFTAPENSFQGWLDVWRYVYWIYRVSLMILLFNLLPIYPLDGGQLLQSILWPIFGYYKSMLFSCTTGMVGAILGGCVALATGHIGLAILAVFGFMACYQMKQAVRAMGPEEYADGGIDYSAAYEVEPTRKRKVSRWSIRRAAKRAQKLAAQDRREQERIDVILAKVSAHGMHSLTWWEKRALKKATEHQRQRDMEIARRRV